MRSNYIGLLLILLVLAAALLLGGSFRYFINGPSLIFVSGTVFGSLVFHFGLYGIKQAYSSSKSRKQLCRFGRSASLLAGLLGFLIGFVQMCVYTQKLSDIGHPLALAILSVFYGSVLALFFLLAESRHFEWVEEL